MAPDMAPPSSLIWSLRAALRSPWTWGPMVIAAATLPLVAKWTALSILTRPGAEGGVPGEFAFLAALVAVWGACRTIDRMDWILLRVGRLKRVGLELVIMGLPAVIAPLGVVTLGSAQWGWPDPEALGWAAGQGIRLALLALLLSRLGLRPGVRMGLLPVLAWWLPATLAGMPGFGPPIASLLSAGTWPAIQDSPFGSLEGPALRSLVGWVALLLACTPGRGRHAVRDSR